MLNASFVTHFLKIRIYIVASVHTAGAHRFSPTIVRGGSISERRSVILPAVCTPGCALSTCSKRMAGASLNSSGDCVADREANSRCMMCISGTLPVSFQSEI